MILETSFNTRIPIETYTNEEGYYQFAFVPGGFDFTITPSLDEDCACGLTNADSDLINQFLDNPATFNSPYQYIAADVNKSNSITGFDGVAINQLLESGDSQFTNNTCWRFITADANLPTNLSLIHI